MANYGAKEHIRPDNPSQSIEFSLDHHHEWDEYVREIAGGATIFRSAQGHWVDPTDWAHFSERMIPVQIACSEKQMLEIADFTKQHYEQRKVFFYEVSQKVFIV